MAINSGDLAGAGIKSIQRGVSILTAVNSLNVTISAVDISKTTLSYLGFIMVGSVIHESFNYIRLTNSTTLQLVRTSISSDATTVSWEVIEYV